MKLKLSLSLVFYFILSFSLLATTYYVSPSGNDGNSGTSEANAWKTLTNVNSTDFLPGDSLLLEGNKIYTGNIYIDPSDAGGGMASPFVIGSYGTGKAIIISENNYGIYIYNTAGIIVENLFVEGSGKNNNSESGISFYMDKSGDVKLDYIEIRNCEVSGYGVTGITIGAYNWNSGYSNVTISDCIVHDCLDNGIDAWGEFNSSKTGYAHSNINIKNCKVFNIPGYSKTDSHSGNGIVLGDVQNSTVEHCVVYNCGSGNTHCGGPVGIWYWDSDLVTIQFNEVYNISSGTGCDGGGFDLDGGVTNGIMQYNYSHDNDGAGFLVGQFQDARPMENITVRYNISENDAHTNAGSIHLFKGPNTTMTDIYIYNNTCYLTEQSTNTGTAVFKFLNWNTGINNVNVYNNIFYAANGADVINIPTGYDADLYGNLYYSDGAINYKYHGSLYTSLTDFRTATGKEYLSGNNTGLEADPMLTDPGNGGIIGFGNYLINLTAYQLQENAPCIDAGIDINTAFGIDIGSRSFYSVYTYIAASQDIGAHEREVVIDKIQKEDRFISHITLSPNPVVDDLKIETNKQLANLTVNIYDISGKIVYKDKIDASCTNIPLKNLAKGVYHVVIKTDESIMKTQKLIKL
jgi:hypothetical protein